MRGILLKNERMVHAVRLAAASADLNIVWEACLDTISTRSANCHVNQTYPHSSMECSSNLVILLQSRTAPKNLRKPELSHSSLHVSNLSLRWCGCLYPLRRLSPNTTHHVGMGEGFRCPLLRLDVQCGRDGLCDSGVQRRCPAGDNQVLIGVLIPRTWTPVSCSRSNERRVVVH